MNTPLRLSAALVGLTMAWATPALAQDPPAVAQGGPSAVVVNNNASPGRGEGGEHRAYPGLIWGGVVVWGVAYAPAVIGAAAGNDACNQNSSFCVSSRGVLVAPVVGPFIALGNASGTNSDTLKALLAVDGAFQVAGLGMILTGVILSATSGPTRTASTFLDRTAERQMSFAPMITPTSAGLGMVGRF